MKAAFIALVLSLALLCQGAPDHAGPPNDVDYLTFALQLEYLEGEFYSCAAFGRPLDDSLRGGGPASTGCIKAALDGPGQAYAEEIANNEIDHVTFLRTALAAAGATVTPIPAINIGTAFAAAANAAAGTTLNPPFSPYASSLFFFHGAFIFEDVGVTAYNGAVPLLTNPAYVGAAAGIEAVEAYHAGIIRLLLYINQDVELPYNVTVAEFVQDIANLRDAVDGPQVDDAGIVTPSGAADLVPVGPNSIVFARSPAEVLPIVYLGSSTPGGFFPNGINGYFGP